MVSHKLTAQSHLAAGTAGPRGSRSVIRTPSSSMNASVFSTKPGNSRFIQVVYIIVIVHQVAFSFPPSEYMVVLCSHVPYNRYGNVIYFDQ